MRSGPAGDTRLPVACVHKTLAEGTVCEAVLLEVGLRDSAQRAVETVTVKV